jgi:hypothetical protein
MAKSSESMAKPQEARSPDPPGDLEAPDRLFQEVARAAAAAACELDVVRLVEVILEQMRLLGATLTYLAIVEAVERALMRRIFA